MQSPDYSFFLFGPRGTGKTTWLRENFGNAFWKNLLLDRDYLPLLSHTSEFAQQVEALPDGSWVVIDEVQRIPSLLNEVHNLISLHGKRYRFAMSGSSARKLRRLESNLLAGRAIEKRMHSLCSAELANDFNLDQALTTGLLPTVIANQENAIEILSTYVGTYLKQEIQQEALVEDIGAFHRFLKVAGIMNAETINVSAAARDSMVSRSTAERYFDILIDTLIGFRLPGWQPQLKVKERLTPKFYFFDCGVARACTGRVRDKLSDLEVGKLLETFVLHELRCAIDYRNLGGELFYWQSGGGAAVDFVWERGEQRVAIEVKASRTWRKSYGRALRDFAESKYKIQCYGVYQGETALQVDQLLVLPLPQFLERLHCGEILGG